MGSDGKREACGRCSLTSVVDMLSEDDEGTGRNPFDGGRIELPESDVRAVSPHVIAMGRVKDRLDDWAAGVIYGR